MYREEMGNQDMPLYAPIPPMQPVQAPGMPPMYSPQPMPPQASPGLMPGMQPMPDMMPGMPCPHEHMNMFMQAYHHVSMAHMIMTQMLNMMQR